MLRCMEKIKLMGTGKLDYGDLFFHFRDTKSLDVLSLLSSIIDFQCTFTHYSAVQKWESYSTKWHCFVPMVIGLQGETVEIHITYLGRIAFKNRGLGPKYLLRILILRMLSVNRIFPLRESQIGPWLENYYLPILGQVISYFDYNASFLYKKCLDCCLLSSSKWNHICLIWLKIYEFWQTKQATQKLQRSYGLHSADSFKKVFIFLVRSIFCTYCIRGAKT